MAKENITICIDEKLKKQADELFNDFGLSFNEAVVMFTKQCVCEQKIPFEIIGNTVFTASNDKVKKVSKQLIEQNMEAYKELAK